MRLSKTKIKNKVDGKILISLISLLKKNSEAKKNEQITTFQQTNRYILL